MYILIEDLFTRLENAYKSKQKARTMPRNTHNGMSLPVWSSFPTYERKIHQSHGSVARSRNGGSYL